MSTTAPTLLTPAQIRQAYSALGRKGGKARAKAIANGTAVGSLGGRPPDAETVETVAKILAAIPLAKGDARKALCGAFTRLATSEVYQTNWRAKWGPKLTEAERRTHGRGLSETARAKALETALGVLAAS